MAQGIKETTKAFQNKPLSGQFLRDVTLSGYDKQVLISNPEKSLFNINDFDIDPAGFYTGGTLPSLSIEDEGRILKAGSGTLPTGTGFPQHNIAEKPACIFLKASTLSLPDKAMIEMDLLPVIEDGSTVFNGGLGLVLSGDAGNITSYVYVMLGNHLYFGNYRVWVEHYNRSLFPSALYKYPLLIKNAGELYDFRWQDSTLYSIKAFWDKDLEGEKPKLRVYINNTLIIASSPTHALSRLGVCVLPRYDNLNSSTWQQHVNIYHLIKLRVVGLT